MTTPNDPNGPGQSSPPPQGPAGGQFQPPPPPPGAYPPPYPYPAYPPPQAAKSGGVGSRVATYLISSILIMSLALNVYFIALASVAMRSVPKVTASVYQKGEKDHRIVIIPIEGAITEPTFYFTRDALESIDTNPPKAIVLRIDSPGGTVGASDRIWHALDRYRKKHPNVPIVASFGSLSASGGYYISTKSDYIMAEPVCITGSIGVIANMMTIGGLLEKIGVTPETTVADGSPKKSVANDITRAWNDEDRKKLRDVLNFAHERFVEVVKGGFAIRFPGDGEGPSDDQIEALADGSIFNTDEAIENKLIDSEGYLDAAIDKAASLAGVPAGETPHVIKLGVPVGLLDALMAEEKGMSITSIDGNQIRDLLIEAGTPRLEYRFELLQP